MQLACCVCKQPMDLQRACLAFPADSLKAEAKWVHKDCLLHHRVILFGTPVVILLKGQEAFVHLAEQFETQRRVNVSLE